MYVTLYDIEVMIKKGKVYLGSFVKKKFEVNYIDRSIGLKEGERNNYDRPRKGGLKSG